MRTIHSGGVAGVADITQGLPDVYKRQPSGWIATNALMAASDPRFAGEFWAAVDERGGLER